MSWTVRILERLVTPFEHMLRNAIDHGIEYVKQRSAAKKSVTGQIETQTLAVKVQTLSSALKMMVKVLMKARLKRKR